MMSKETLADKFIKAGNASVSIDWADLEVLGIKKKQKQFKSVRGYRIAIKDWEEFCSFVYERVTGKALPGSPLGGRGYRSRHYAKIVSEAILKHG